MAFVKPTGSELAPVDRPDGFDDLGELGNVLSIFPEGRTAVSTMNARIMRDGVLSQAVRSLVGAVAAASWSDTLQMDRHLQTYSAETGMSVDDARSMVSEPDWPQVDEAERALLRYVTKAATNAFKMVPGDVEALASQGWGERQTVEALTVVCTVAYMAVANLALGIGQPGDAGEGN